MDLKDKIKNIARYEYMDFMRYPNVVGVGCGNKYINNIDTGQLCIQVYVKKKYPKECNGEGNIPSYYYGIPTDVIESGEFFTSGFDAKIRPMKMGYGIVADDPKAQSPGGTVGCIVTRIEATGNYEFFILGNNHVMVGLNRLPLGTPILQPYKERLATDRIATLTDFIPLNFTTPQARPENDVDVAIAKIDDINIVRPQIAFIGIPKGIDIKPVQGSMVKKSGAATGYTVGKIESESAHVNINTKDGRHCYFVDQIIATKMSDEGDSGAVVLNEDNKIIGLIMGASPQFTLINKIEIIQSALKVYVYGQN